MTDKEAFLKAEKLFIETFNEKPSTKEISYGRLEIIGNHTDHQHGKCLVATCSLGIRGYIEKADTLVSIHSDGYDVFSFSSEDLEFNKHDGYTTKSLTRGVLYALKKMGYKVGGFNASLVSDIFPGAGVSSSAAYELFIAEAINYLYNDNQISKINLAKAGQFAENVYFGKASGLLDQCGSAYGGIAYLDFKDINNPIVEPIAFPSSWPLSIILINPGASHAGLSDLYSEMPNDMKEVAKTIFSKEVLSDVSEKEFVDALSNANWDKVTSRAKLRASHYFGEVKRVERAYKAIKEQNLDAFLEIIKEGELSQERLLKNVMIPNQYEGSPLEAVNRANLFLNRGAARVMGGGLVGTTINFVPSEEKEKFINGMKEYYGDEKIVEVFIPSLGAHIEK